MAAGIALSASQRLDWLRLIRSKGIGPRGFRSLANRFGGAGAALEALPDLARQAGRSVRICSLAEAERETEGLARLGGRFIATQFYADIEGHPEDSNVKLALEELEFFSKEVRILGVYKGSDVRDTHLLAAE